MRYALLLVVALAAAGCGDSPTAPSVVLGQDVRLAPGERVEVAGSFTLEFEGVVNDSRCPADALCVTGGDATVRLLARRPNGVTNPVDLHTGDMAPVQYATYTVSLIELSPYPFSARPIAPEDYRVTIRIS